MRTFMLGHLLLKSSISYPYLQILPMNRANHHSYWHQGCLSRQRRSLHLQRPYLGFSRSWFFPPQTKLASFAMALSHSTRCQNSALPMGIQKLGTVGGLEVLTLMKTLKRVGMKIQL